jgi:hypothetical protein
MAFLSRAAFDASHPDALAVYCSDGRFTQAVEELAEHLGHRRIDTVTLAGGAALLDAQSALLSDRDAMARALDFLIEGHAIKHLILVAHEGCGYYRARFPLHGAEKLRARQKADLIGARQRLLREGLQIALYFAMPHKERVRFEEVE